MFYRGIVEDVKDPTNSGRVRVRVMPMFDGLPVEHLPWAMIADSSFSSEGVGGLNIPQPGSIVWVFFEQDDHRYPVVFAGSPALSEAGPDIPKSGYEKDSTVSSKIDANRKTGIATASAGSWDEPEYTPNVKYPDNHVIRTRDHLIS